MKVPVFRFAKLRRVDTSLGPEMKSTGEVMGKDTTLEKALYKGLVASGMESKTYGTVLFTVADKDKEEALIIAKRFKRRLPYYGDSRNSESIREAGIPQMSLEKLVRKGKH